MTQSVVPFLHTPLEAPEFLELWRETVRSGVARASEATTGGSGWKVTVKAGEVIIDGSWIYDDLDKIDGLDLGHLVGTDKHYVVYQTYAYAGSDPPATSVFSVSAGVTPPTQPTIPAGAVKLCDIFVPSTAGSIGTVPGINQQDPVQVSSTGVRFVQAPRLWPVQDTGELMDKLVMAGSNTMLFTQGAISYNDATGQLTLSQPVIVQSTCTTYRQSFNNAPSIVRSTIPAGVSVAPGTPGSRDVIVYTLIDRSTPNTALAGTIKFLNRVAPSATELNELLSYANRTQIVILGVINGAKLFLPGIQGQLPAPDADARKFLKDDPAGSHTWNLLNDIYFQGGAKAGLADTAARNAIASDLRKQGLIAYTQAEDELWSLIGGVADGNWAKVNDDSRFTGGFRVIEWTEPTYANATAALNALVPSGRRKRNMIVRARNTNIDVVEEFRWNGSAWDRATEISSIGKFGVVSGCAVTNPTANSIVIAPGEFYLLDGTKIVLAAAKTLDLTGINATRTIAWDASLGDFALLTSSTAEFPDLVFGHVVHVTTGGGITFTFIDCKPNFRSLPWTGEITVGTNIGSGAIPAHFTSLKKAMVWYASYAINVGIPRTFRIIDSFQIPATTVLTSATSAIDAGGVLTDGTGRFFRDLAVGDGVRIDTTNYTVGAVTSDTQITLNGWASGAQSGKTLTRLDMAARHGEYIKLSYSEYVYSTGYWDSLAIHGQTWAGSAKPTISWGNSLYNATFPLFDMNGVPGISVSGFKGVYLSLGYNETATRHDCCVFKGFGVNSYFDNLVIQGDNLSTTSLTHIFHLSSDLGGDGFSAGGMRINQCAFYGLHHPMSSYFYVPNSTINGTVLCADSIFSQSATTRRAKFFVHYEAGQSTVVFRLRNPFIQYLDVAYAAGLKPGFESISIIGGIIGGQSDVQVKLGVGTFRADDELPDSTQDLSKLDITATVASVTGTVATLTGLTGMGAGDVGSLIQLTGAANAGNNGLFVIVEFVNANSVKIENALANATDANNGTIDVRVFAAYETSSAVTITAIDANGIVTSTGHSSPGDRFAVGMVIQIGGAAVAGNNGKFIVMDQVGGTIKYYNPAGSTGDANNGAIVASVYSEVLPSITIDDARIQPYSTGGMDFQGCRSVSRCNVNGAAATLSLIMRKSVVFSEDDFGLATLGGKPGAIVKQDAFGDDGLNTVFRNEISPKMVAKAWARFSWNGGLINQFANPGCVITRDGTDDRFLITLNNPLLGVSGGLTLGAVFATGGSTSSPIFFTSTAVNATQFRLVPWNASSPGSPIDLDTVSLSEVSVVVFGYGP